MSKLSVHIEQILNWDGEDAKVYSILHDLSIDIVKVSPEMALVCEIVESLQGRTLNLPPSSLTIMRGRTLKMFALQRKWQAELCN